MSTTIASPNKYAGRIEPVEVIVVHTMEAPETAQTAENIARYFARPTTRASAHLCVDNDSVVRCVPDADTAWAAPGANANGLQLELAGYARQTPAEWDDAYSRAQLALAASEAAAWARKYGIPVRRLSVAELRAGAKGFVAHDDVSKAFGKSTHWDPGPHFPWARFLSLVSANLGGPAVAAPAAPAAPAKPAPSGLTVDGKWGPATTRALQARFGTTVDGVISHQWRDRSTTAIPSAQFDTTKRGSQLVRAMQKWLGGLTVDGLLGTRTITALQRRLGTPVDGVISPVSSAVKEMQRRLNAGSL
ncbi:peptidoglycan recognition protein family protein [Cellulomonas oligotrophica]|uniref:N-acetylmuramoyl-L-alanine amidase n=1 Tax=Cellulomonas oligotrophica TaxID=931536 RepID=A0A7Y9K0Y7_9CELL|nr:N-acetylmuramoyl-L-alanine amidase [Cellulomonas oligotrophica]NYD87770.1 hypothetical protein [Cellulomonas oligotrophica]GIG33025.1 hypothetical protein Col01nite_21840 [Cellulomonas oligotrophica]